MSVGEEHADELVALVKTDRDLAALALILELGELRSLENAVLGDHCEESFLGIIEIIDLDDRCDLLTRLELENVDDIRSLCGSARLGDHIRLAHIDLAVRGEHHQVRMAVHYHYLFDEVLFLRRHTDDTLAASSLSRIGIRMLTLDVARMCDSDDAIVLFDEVLKQNIIRRLNDLSAARVAVSSLDLGKLGLDDLLDLFDVAEDRAELFDELVKSFELVKDLVALETRESAERHLDDRLRLDLAQSISFAKSRLRIGDRLRGLHQLNDLVDVVESDRVTLKNMSARKSTVELILRSSGDNGLLMLDILVDDGDEGQDLRLAVDEREHIDCAGVLELAVFIKLF